jgi:hypothetical protein
MGNQETRAEARSSPASTPVVRSADALEASTHPRTVIVPLRPGSLREYEPRSERPRDELDDLIAELFGPETDERPGLFDAGLAVAGLSLATWAIVLGGPSVALWAGIAAIVLGLALPARAVLRRFGRAPSGGPRRRTGDQGFPLDASHPATLALIDAHARLMQVSSMKGRGHPDQVVSAGHEAVVEVARRLAGQPPDTPEKVRLVSMWTDALEALTQRVLRSDASGTHPTPRRSPVERRWMPSGAQAGSPTPRGPTTSSGRRA